MKKITICGGGSLGHVAAAVLGSHNDIQISLLTRRPQSWGTTITATDSYGKTYCAPIVQVSADPKDVIPTADIVLFCLPGFLIEETLNTIHPHLQDHTIVGSIVSSTGFFFFAHKILNKTTGLFGFQRVPFIARIADYGKHGLLLGYKNQLNIAIENVEEKNDLRVFLQTALNTPTVLLNSFYEAALTNSNPILHTGRLYAMWHDWQGETRPECGLFYKEWNDSASEILIKMDQEFQQLLSVLGVRKEEIPPLLDYYESTDATSLTRKISSIPAFADILSPMRETANGWIPDFESRYFTEDFPYGLRFIYDLAHQHQLNTPTIDMVYQWGMSKINQ